MAKSGKFRWVICALLFFSVAINYIDRLVIGILKKPLSDQLGWSDSDYGNIAAAFSFAYAFGYLVGGRLTDRLGVKRGLSLFVLCWSAAAMAHGFCGFIVKGVTFQLKGTQDANGIFGAERLKSLCQVIGGIVPIFLNTFLERLISEKICPSDS